MLKLQKLFFDATKRLEFFEQGNWKFINKKGLAILRSLSPEEQVEFDCDINNINWPAYMINYGRGM